MGQCGDSSRTAGTVRVQCGYSVGTVRGLCHDSAEKVWGQWRDCIGTFQEECGDSDGTVPGVCVDSVVKDLGLCSDIEGEVE